MALRPSCSCCCLLIPVTEPGSGNSGVDVGVADQTGTAMSQVSRMATTFVANVRWLSIVCSRVANVHFAIRGMQYGIGGDVLKASDPFCSLRYLRELIPAA